MNGNINEKKDFDKVTPYRASGNLNTVINNPAANINDTMNVNIQTTMTKQDVSPSYNEKTSPTLNTTINNTSEVKSTVTRTYVTNDNRPKKKRVSLNLGPEFKIALLIIVILLIFIFIMPMITDLVKPH